MRRAEILQLIRGAEVFEETAGTSDLLIGIIDGPIATNLPDFQGTTFQTLENEGGVTCQLDSSFACQHGTFITGVLGANRNSEAPALCPDCHFLLRPIFCEEGISGKSCPIVTPKDLADALLEVMEAGARIINLSLGLADDELHNHPVLKKAYDYAEQKEIILVGATGNQKRIGRLPLFQHPWVIPVAACDAQGRILQKSNTGYFVAKRGLMAPGENIVSTSSAGGTTQMTGTSMAAPFVTGALALLWSLYPEVAVTELVTAILQPNTLRKQIFPPLLNLEESRQYLERVSSQDGPMKKGRVMKQTSNFGIVPAGVSALVSPASHQDIQTQGCTSCTQESFTMGEEHPGYIYAIGQLTAKFPSEGVRREFNRVSDLANFEVPDDRIIYEVLQNGQYLYLAWEMDWVLESNDVEIYLVKPRSEIELNEMVAALKPTSGQSTYSVVVGLRIPDFTQEGQTLSNLPMVLCNQFYNFTFEGFVQNVMKQANVTQPVAESMFQSMLEKTDGTGATDGSRAINYLTLRYMGIYKDMAAMVNAKNSFTGANAIPAVVMGTRQIVDVIFEYETRDLGRTLWQRCRVDVTGPFPFLIAELSPHTPLP